MITKDGREIKCRSTRVTASGAVEITKTSGTFELPADRIRTILRDSGGNREADANAPAPRAKDEITEEERAAKRQEREGRTRNRAAKKVRSKIANALKWTKHWAKATRDFETQRLAAEQKLPDAEEEVERKRRHAASFAHSCTKRCTRRCSKRKRVQEADRERVKAEVAAARIRASINKAEKGLKKTTYSTEKAKQRLERAVVEANKDEIDVSDLLPDPTRDVDMGLFEIGDLKGLVLESPTLVPNGRRLKLTARLRNETPRDLQSVQLAVEFYGPHDTLLKTSQLTYRGLPTSEWAADETYGPNIDATITRVRIRLASAW